MPVKLTKAFRYEYARPALAVDVVLIARQPIDQVLLIQRKHEPFAKSWALPGGFVHEGERLADAARRELHEETDVSIVHLEQLYTAGDPGRDPRGWTISVVYLAFVPDAVPATGSDDASRAKWFRLNRLPKLAFDHKAILQRALTRLQDRTS